MELTGYIDPRDPMQGASHRELFRSPDDELSVVCSLEVSTADQEALWNIVQGGFAALDSRSYERQSMSIDELVADMQSPDILKYVAYDAAQQPVGFMTVHVGLDSVEWIEKDRFQKEQDNVDPTATPYYIGTLVVTPDVRGGATAPALVQSALRHFRDLNEAASQKSLAFFDCAHMNYPWLGQHVANIAKPSEYFEGVPIQISELGVNYFAEEIVDEGIESSPHLVQKMSSLGTGKYNIRDIQHFYSIELTEAA